MDKRPTGMVDLFLIPRYPSSPARPVIPGSSGDPVIPDLFGNPSASAPATPGACCFAALYG